MKKLLSMVLIGLLVLSGCSKQKSEFVIGVIQWAEHAALDATFEGLKKGLADQGVSDVKFVHKNAQESGPDAQTMIDQLVNEGVDLIYAIATPAAQAAMSGAEHTDIPIVFNAVTDAVDAGLVSSNEKPGGNITGVSDAAPVDIQLGLIKEMLPNANKVGVLFNTGETNSGVQIEIIKSLVGKHGLSLELQGVSSHDEISLATQSLLNRADVLYLITDNMVAKATAQIINLANDAKTPVFGAEDGQFDLGMLASDSISYFELGVQAGSVVKSILIDGKKPAEIAVETATKTNLLVSESVAKALGIEIPAAILERANLK